MSRNNIEQDTSHYTQRYSARTTRSNGTQYWSHGTEELAVMVDTFRPLMVTEEAMGLDDGQYYKSWVE
jgi:homogentisate 1,2-dioxygenase